MSDTPLIKGGLRGQGGSNLKSIFNLIITSYLGSDCSNESRNRVKFQKIRPYQPLKKSLRASSQHSEKKKRIDCLLRLEK
ncbi:MAG: hypothetical protein EWV53_18540 [Microcystis panniformis Mp_MB_F_20051200_S9]|uniref:Uncharacterized protein n=1 Tax=Microcystis panniformis Mp_MB_F_20051200_S9 TaxID=2486223 RepID=A0A552PNQ1_9CHRO|nr:MAG: hypothetical protein EWV43_19205 [Microcystis panniformis Mp_MB_F_20080800_S26D]TRV52454.1 MAG: hypothetical protein EWV42_07950 [Microcystis panniformis Mp_GB_SS_20050300_S99D]TRV54462.1 MAG: hypothetical protein EWV87_00765 [Microcystis panniformis Mp_GB_SS_20050300_S99]TRV58607.1 MAG: hypothetical protein EWV53_18540 [Microcystis panniformis Mp_MB_F_20051200_S9]TRV59257.1 MAG: hypothetical protein EWV69_12220 [Microcystis panniformis Mp_MB_F_20080800_S26]TRV62181.1 MAG: hypothetical